MTNTRAANNPELLEAPKTAATPGTAIFSFVMGIFSTVGLMITGVPAIIFGHVALRRIKNSPIHLNGKGFAMTGIIMGWLSVAVTLVVTAIIALGVMAIPKMAGSTYAASDDRASETAARLKAAIGAYHEEYGSYPFPESTAAGAIVLSDATIMNPLMAKETPPTDTDIDTSKRNPKDIAFYTDERGSMGLFTDPGSGLSYRGSKVRLVDPWGTPYQVKLNANTPGSYDTWQDKITVWSVGRDKTDGTDDDIVAEVKSPQAELVIEAGLVE